ncbi:MAG TPA: LysM domain-containing protein [Caldilineaceae bacterium]|nr:LysM domain-containing protein [Caldilineaceae bacterium]
MLALAFLWPFGVAHAEGPSGPNGGYDDSKGRGYDMRVACVAIHHVAEGETLAWIAADYGVSESSIAEANGLEDANLIYVDQELCIPAYGVSDGGKYGPNENYTGDGYNGYDGYKRDDGYGNGGYSNGNDGYKGYDGPGQPYGYGPQDRGYGGQDMRDGPYGYGDNGKNREGMGYGYGEYAGKPYYGGEDNGDHSPYGYKPDGYFKPDSYQRDGYYPGGYEDNGDNGYSQPYGHPGMKGGGMDEGYVRWGRADENGETR